MEIIYSSDIIEQHPNKYYYRDKYFIIECAKGNLEAVKYLYNKYSYFDEVINAGFKEACKHGNLSIIKFIESNTLVFNNFSLNLAYTCKSNLQTVQYLLDKSDKIGLKIDELLCLYHSIINGNIEITKLFLNRGVIPDITALNYSIDFPNIYNLLFQYPSIKENLNFIKIHFKYLCYQGQYQEIKNLFDNNLLTSCQENAYTILKYSKTINIIKFLFNIFTDIDFYLLKVLMDNKNNLFFEALEYIEFKFPDFYKSIDFIQLFKASCITNKIDIAKILYDKYKNIISNEFMEQVFYTVVKRNNLDIVKYLININSKNEQLIESFTNMCSVYIKDIHVLREIMPFLDTKLFSLQNLMNIYCICFSHKKKVLNIILNKDLYFFINSF